MTQHINRREFVARAAAGSIAVAGLHVPSIVRAEADKWGDLVGRFVFDGPVPQRKKLKVDKDLECCGKFDIRDESLLVAPDGSLANVFLYVRSKSVEVCPELDAAFKPRVTLDNRDCIFKPHCLTLWIAKQDFYTINSDRWPRTSPSSRRATCRATWCCR
jgi:hypothetical protein